MKKRHHTPAQIIMNLVEGDKLQNQGEDLAEVCQQLETAESTRHRWKAEYVGMKMNDATRLKKIVADLTLGVHILN